MRIRIHVTYSETRVGSVLPIPKVHVIIKSPTSAVYLLSGIPELPVLGGDLILTWNDLF